MFVDLVVEPLPGAVSIEIDAVPGTELLRLRCNEQITTHRAARALDQLVGYLNDQVIEASTATVDVHAAAMAHPAGAATVVFVGPPGSGKTTMAAHLCRAGWTYLSDEVVGVRIDDGALEGFPKPLTIKTGLHETLGLDLSAFSIDVEHQQRWYVRPALLGATPTAAAPAPTDVVFVDFDPVATTTELVELAPHDALVGLLTNVFRVERHRDELLVSLGRLVAGARAWRLRTGDADKAIAQLVAAIAQTDPADRDWIEQRSPMEPAAGRGPRPAPGTVFFGFTDGGAVVFDQERSEAISLDITGADIWLALDGMRTTTELINRLATSYATNTGDIAHDVEGAVASMVAEGFVIEP